jgi:hypothetical protein
MGHHPSSVYGVDMTFRQSGSTVTGTWRLPTLGWTGTTTGTIDADGRYTGTIALVAPDIPQGTRPQKPAGCSDSGTVTDIWAPRNPRNMTLIARFDGACAVVSQLELSLDRLCQLIFNQLWILSCAPPG